MLSVYAYCGRYRLAHTALIDPKFLLNNARRMQMLVYGVVAIVLFIATVS